MPSLPTVFSFLISYYICIIVFNTKNFFNIYNSYSAKFDKMPYVAGRCSYQGLVGNPSYFTRIVCNKTVTALDKLDSRFTLTNA